jgi:GntR family transcriptional regulator, rspAB operon transcriptional repressor
MDKITAKLLGGKLDGVQQLVEPVTLEESAYREIRRVITDGILQPGERLSVNAMAQRMGVSRLPVIHALRRLASEGFIQIKPHKSPTVSQPSIKEIRVRSQMMAALEEIAVNNSWPLAPHYLAEMQQALDDSNRSIRAGILDEDADWRFHRVVWRASGVDRLQFTIQTLWDQGAFYRSLGFKTFGPQPNRMAEHEGILQALSLPTPHEAITRIRAHRLGALNRLLQVFATGDNAEVPPDYALAVPGATAIAP